MGGQTVVDNEPLAELIVPVGIIRYGHGIWIIVTIRGSRVTFVTKDERLYAPVSLDHCFGEIVVLA